jgi:hypothetical protein
MTLKEKLEIAFKFSALAVFLCLGSSALDHREDCQMRHFGAGMPHMSGAEGMFIMEMDDMDHSKKMDVRIEKEIIDGEEKVKITVNGKEMSEEEFAKIKDENHNIMKWKTCNNPKKIIEKKMHKKYKK